MAPRLKVFVTSDGLTDYVVATSSRAKALAAWGVRQDVFKEGQAYETAAPDLVKAATARPGEVLRRPTGARGELARLKVKPRPAPAGPSKAARKKVADLERRLAALEARQAKAVADLDARRAELERRREEIGRSHARERQALEARLKSARDAPG